MVIENYSSFGIKIISDSIDKKWTTNCQNPKTSSLVTGGVLVLLFPDIKKVFEYQDLECKFRY